MDGAHTKSFWVPYCPFFWPFSDGNFCTHDNHHRQASKRWNPFHHQDRAIQQQLALFKAFFAFQTRKTLNNVSLQTQEAGFIYLITGWFRSCFTTMKTVNSAKKLSIFFILQPEYCCKSSLIMLKLRRLTNLSSASALYSSHAVTHT